MNRDEWKSQRIELEKSFIKRAPSGKKFLKTYDFFHLIAVAFYYFLKIIFIAKQGEKNSLKLKTKEIIHKIKGLPDQFNRFKILHLSDLHFDENLSFSENLLKKMANIEVDLVVITGDFASSSLTNDTVIQDTVEQLQTIIKKIKSNFGQLAVLGNHDSSSLVIPLEGIGIKVLINEYYDLEKGGEEIRIIGLDDVNSFYTPAASDILKSARDKFSICLVHSPDILGEASENGVRLYLCGHTHGGQICLPGEIPIVSHANVPRKYCVGGWRYKQMIGYTSRGVGVSAIPIRFNSRPEIVFHTLVTK